MRANGNIGRPRPNALLLATCVLAAIVLVYSLFASQWTLAVIAGLLGLAIGAIFAKSP